MADPKDAPKPGTPEYDAAKVAQFDKSQDPNAIAGGGKDPIIPQIPEGGHAKFYDAKTGAYNWAGHAKELQYQIDQSKGKKPDEGTKPDPKEGDQPDDSAQNVIERAGLKVEDLSKQLVDNGKLDDASKAALVKTGIPESLVDEYVELVAFRIAENRKQALEYAGGKEAWDQLNQWAQTTLPAEDKTRINKMLASPDWKDAIDLLKAKRTKADPLGKEGKGINDGGKGPTVTGYASRAEQQADMRSEKYKTDPAFRQLVYRRTQVSNFDNQPRS